MARRLTPAARARTPSYQLRFTRGGLLFFVGSTLIGLAAVDSNMNPLLVIFGLCLGAVVLNFFSGWRTLRALSVARISPDVLVAGQPGEFRYIVANNRTWSVARGVRLVDVLKDGPAEWSPAAFFPALRPGESITRAAPLRIEHRGRLDFVGVRLTTSFPFGIFAKSVTHPLPDSVVVLPRLARLTGDLVLSAKVSEAPGSAATPLKSRGDEEFYGLREYRPGDNPRRIHWRRTAQSGQLMVREMSKARDLQLWVVIDTRIDARNFDHAPALERVYRAAATTICFLLEQSTKVGLICNGDPLLVLPAGRGRHRRTRLLSEMAVRTVNTDDALAPHVARLAWPSRWRGLCMLFAAADSPDLRDAARLLRHAVGPVSVWIPGKPAFDSMFSFDQPAGPKKEPAP